MNILNTTSNANCKISNNAIISGIVMLIREEFPFNCSLQSEARVKELYLAFFQTKIKSCLEGVIKFYALPTKILPTGITKEYHDRGESTAEIQLH